MPDRRSTNFVKSTVFFYLARLLLLCRVLHTVNLTILSLPVFLMVSLEKKILLLLSQPDTNIVLGGQSFLPYSNGKKKQQQQQQRFLCVLSGVEPITGQNSQKAVHHDKRAPMYNINVDPAPTHRSSSDFISWSDETQVGYSHLCPIRIHLK